MIDDNFRPLSPVERRLLEKLLEMDFVGRAELLRQLPDLLAKRLDDTRWPRWADQFDLRERFVACTGGKALDARDLQRRWFIIIKAAESG
jgi:hypothetical protein